MKPMMKQQTTVLQHLETLGYFPLPRPHTESPGFSGLLVVLQHVVHRHEPETIQLRLHEWDGKTPQMTLHANQAAPLAHVVCPGRVIIRSRQDREATFYTFGGSLESETLPGETILSLRSSAPILELVPEQETIADLLAEEAEALFARAAAQLRLTSEQMLDRLVKAGPEAVYLSVVHALLVYGDETAVAHDPAFTKMLHQERDWFQRTGRWPLMPRDLVTLLQTGNGDD